MKKITFFIVEDDPIIAADIEGMLLDLGYHVIGIAHQPFDAKEKILNLMPDIILMDVNLNDTIDGVDLAYILSKKKLRMVFITAFTDKKTIERIKPLSPLGYIIKPFTTKEIEITIELAVNQYINEQDVTQIKPFEPYIFVKAKNFSAYKILYDEILFLEAYDSYCFVYTNKDKILVSSTLKELETSIKSPRFIRVHRSFMINLDKVEGVKNLSIIIGKHEIPIGKSYKDAIMPYFPTL